MKLNLIPLMSWVIGEMSSPRYDVLDFLPAPHIKHTPSELFGLREAKPEAVVEMIIAMAGSFHFTACAKDERFAPWDKTGATTFGHSRTRTALPEVSGQAELTGGVKAVKLPTSLNAG